MPKRWTDGALSALRAPQPPFAAYYGGGLAYDAATDAFVQECRRRREAWAGLPAAFRRVAVLGLQLLGYSRVDAVALLGCDMFVLSAEAWGQLLGEAPPSARLLDVGAGTGRPGAELARWAGPAVRRAVETSPSCREALRQGGWDVYEAIPGGQYDIVACLNVLDRCRRPRELLARLAGALAPGGRLVLAAVVPFCPYVEDGGASAVPDESLGFDGADSPDAVLAGLAAALGEVGLRICRHARLPYLSASASPWVDVDVLQDVLIVSERHAWGPP